MIVREFARVSRAIIHGAVQAKKPLPLNILRSSKGAGRSRKRSPAAGGSLRWSFETTSRPLSGQPRLSGSGGLSGFHLYDKFL
jgi:hypothetical protein